MAWYDKWAIMVITAATGVGAYNWVRWPDVDATVVAYWVQALGSIAAIIGSMEIFRRQSAATARLAIQERQANMHLRQLSVYAICFAAFELIDDLHHHHQVDSGHGEGVSFYYREIYSEHAFANAEAALAAIPLHDLHSYFLTTGILDLRDALAQVPTFVSSRDGTDDTNAQYDASTYGYLNRIYSLAHKGFSQIQTGTDEARERFPVTF